MTGYAMQQPLPQSMEMALLRMDPRDISRAERICAICSELAPEDDKHHLHYGGICCYSCRAFFRRAHQSTKCPMFECKSGGNCEITVKNRRKCQKCRYARCLRIGMDARWVLTTEQKKVRFRNYLKKKKTSPSEDQQVNHQHQTLAKSVWDNDPYARRAEQIGAMTQKRPVIGEQTRQGNIEAAIHQCSQLMHTMRRSSHYEHMLSSNDLLRGNIRRIHPNPKRLSSFVATHLMEQSQMRSVYARHRHTYNDHWHNNQHQSSTSVPHIKQETHEISYPVVLEQLHNHQPVQPCPRLIPSLEVVKNEPAEDSPEDSDRASSTSTNLSCHSATDQSQIAQILEIYVLAMSDLDVCSQFRDNIMLLHMGEISSSQVSLDSFTMHLCSLVTAYTRFAKQLPLFQSLCEEDKTILVTHNAFLFCQYLLSRYFSAPTGLDQLSWILDTNLPKATVDDLAHLKVIAFEEFNESILRIQDQWLLLKYKNAIDLIGRFFKHPHFYLGLIAFIILFHQTDDMNLRESRRIAKIHEEGVRLLKFGYHDLREDIGVDRVPQLIEALQSMEQVFEASNVLNRPGNMISLAKRSDENSRVVECLTAMTVSVSYTETEERWLHQQLFKFEASYKKQKMPGILISQLLNHFTIKIRLSEDFMPNVMAATCERFRQVLVAQPEFRQLSHDFKAQIWRKNYLSAIALFVVRMESCKSALEQMFYFVEGVGTKINWLQDFPEIPAWLENTQGSYMDKVGEYQLTPDVVRQYYDSLSHVTNLVRDDICFKLLSLMTLLDVSGLESDPQLFPLLKLRLTFLRLLKRRLKAEGCSSFLDYENFELALKQMGDIAKVVGMFIQARQQQMQPQMREEASEKIQEEADNSNL